MAAGPRAAARLVVDRAHGREDGGRRLTGRDLTQSSGPGAEVAAMWSATRAGAKGEEEEEEEAPGIGRPTTREAFRRAAANRSERPPPAARGARRIGDVVTRGKGQGGADSGLAETVRDRDAHAGTRDPMVTGDARAAALGSGGSGDTARRQRRRPTALGQPGGGVGASPGFKESVSGVGLDGAAPRLAGDERRSLGAGGNGGEAVPGGDGAREWFGEVLGSSRTVVARGIGEGAHGGAQSGAAAAKQSNGGAAHDANGKNLGEELTGERGATLAMRRESWRGGRDGGAGASNWRPATKARARRRGRFGGGKPTLAVKGARLVFTGGSGGFVGSEKAATAWMRWAAKWRGPWMTSTMTAAVGLAWSGGKAAAHGVGGDRPVGHLARRAREWAKAVEVLGGDSGKRCRRERETERERENEREKERGREREILLSAMARAAHVREMAKERDGLGRGDGPGEENRSIQKYREVK
uniref:Epstein-Barr virus EBNA-1-like protein n=1 Tax=Oryza sativa subsp. japonica TaxID=39947 RepID=Q7XHU3_ORYSJ|nr:hypothetical protein [Oryza sativa Japonica Group]BAD30522.1 hypothetical protein [Oryza sativa Japonica Group]